MRKLFSPHWLDRPHECYPLAAEACVDAFRKGYSPIQISRYLGVRGAKKVYVALREAGWIRTLPKGRKKKHDIPASLAAALAKCNMSFAQWCCSYSIDPGGCAVALCTPLSVTDPVSCLAHRAFFGDFPRVYTRVFPDASSYFFSLPAAVDPPKSYSSYRIDLEGLRYVARVLDYPDMAVVGDSPEEALKSLLLRLKINAALCRLKTLPSRSQYWNASNQITPYKNSS